ncbi:MAG TPA: phosphoribosylformylglycinamidine synthase subunit PurQ [Verrucomicrobiae bacterium]|nr:phosphoribosylformylglycinamidine synthase subunit PurQ [Verrucomicrobiae bacterium]
MKFGVVTFPGSNCDYDCYHVVADVLKQPVVYLWHKDHYLNNCDVIILPGGFSYGDYLRTGAIARFSPIMREVADFAMRGGIVIGICNGFQILCEAGLLPGALLRNRSLRFVHRPVYLRVEKNDTAFTNVYQKGQVLKMPTAHGDGCYYNTPEEIKKLEAGGQILFRYCDREGKVTEEANPNGSLSNIAGIVNSAGNVMGLMPHPDRAAEGILGSADGAGVFFSMVARFAGMVLA